MHNGPPWSTPSTTCNFAMKTIFWGAEYQEGFLVTKIDIDDASAIT